MNNCWLTIGNFVKLTCKVSMRWKNWRDFKAQHSMHFQGQNWSKIETLSLISQPRFRNFRMKLILWMIREILKMLNQYAVDNPTLPVNLCFSHLIQFLKECKVVPLECRAEKMGRQAFWTRMVYRETFLQIQPRLLQLLIRRNWIHGVLICRNQSPAGKNGNQTPALDPRCQSGPSAKNSVISGGNVSNNCGADQQWLQISDLHFDKFTTPATFACWKIRFKTEVCTCS